MKPALFLVLAGLVVGLGGCATDVEDPTSPAPVVEEQRPPPDQVLSTQLRDPLAALLAGMEIDHGLASVPPQRLLVELPGPLPGP